jgi:hypothetical protein
MDVFIIRKERQYFKVTFLNVLTSKNIMGKENLIYVQLLIFNIYFI